MACDRCKVLGLLLEGGPTATVESKAEAEAGVGEAKVEANTEAEAQKRGVRNRLLAKYT